MNIDDEQLKRDQERVSRVYQHAKTNALGDAPSSAIDDAIRAAARRAVHAGPAPLKKSWVRRWTPQIAVAATVVLTVSVVFVAIDERPDLAPAPVSTMADAARQLPVDRKTVAVPAARQSDTADAPKLRSPPAAQVVPAPEVQFSRATDSVSATAGATLEKKALRADANVSPAPPPPAKLEARRERAADEAVAVNTSAAPLLYAPPASPTAAAAPPATPLASTSIASPQSVFAKEARVAEVVINAPLIAAAKPARENDAGALAPAKQVSQAGTISAAAPAAAVPPSTNAMPIQPQAAREASAATAPSAATPQAKQAIDGLRGLASDSDEKKAKLADKRDAESPDAWIKRMIDLKAQGKLKALREEIAHFKKRYPNRALPKELTELPGE